jgi:hypothetical protein
VGPIQAPVGLGAAKGASALGAVPPAGVRPHPGSGSVTVKKLECSKQVTYNPAVAPQKGRPFGHHDEYISMG